MALTTWIALLPTAKTMVLLSMQPEHGKRELLYKMPKLEES